ncbi:MAG: hypothetical protein Ta2B_16860 [Termitinemataceae bacterium]|nr:MAG: hypothetical protein Ta2B_16860 [Termitinemataceae bacterium]
MRNHFAAQKCGWSERGRRSQPSERNPKPATAGAASSVKAIRRFYGPNKETVGFHDHKNVPEKNPIKALLRRSV